MAIDAIRDARCDEVDEASRGGSAWTTVLGCALVLATTAPPSASGAETVVVSAYAVAARYCVGDGAQPEFCGTLAADARGVALGDLDDDGDPDAVLGRDRYQHQDPEDYSPPEVCWNDGDGDFDCAPIPYALTHMTDPRVADVNADGRLDIALTAAKSNYVWDIMAQVCFNSGDGFVCVPIPAIDFSYRDLAFGDLDGDGYPDLVTAGPSKVCFNDGAGAILPCQDLVPPDSEHWAVALGDVDADGNLDIAIAGRAPYPYDQPIRDLLCFGNGGGLFDCLVSPDLLQHRDVAVGDVDGDGYDDLVFAGPAGDDPATSICLGGVSGAYPECHVADPYTRGANAVSVADIDADGKAEIGLALASAFGNEICRFLGIGIGGELQLDCETFDTAIADSSDDIALWSRLLFRDGFESGGTSRW